MKKNEKIEMMFLPIEEGLIKLYIYGFKSAGAWGQVIAEFNDVTINIKGYSRKKSIVRALAKLNNALINKSE
ncbi:hypothetical protein [Falsibacillus pallidus]|uniref:Uncharacterized protein n=1 Tax=Falsibacillus pallidus TaxID=493781 RepID=A0A370GVF4_9BACI|nr:hypothetical protein [Falsibacillus pallidus]RDI47647.1 hypothetical protein DFR59_101306 [Falsibacillus pallidus]